MLYSVKHGQYPDHNFFYSAPPYIPSQEIILDKNQLNFKFINPFTNLYSSFPKPSPNQLFFNQVNAYPLWPSPNKKTFIKPKQVEIKIIKSEANEISVSSTTEENSENSKPKHKNLFNVKSICENNYYKNEKEKNDISLLNNLNILEDTKTENKGLTEINITKFNTDKQLKKIHSTYHLKRKVSTKFQNEIKTNVNKLINECNNYFSSCFDININTIQIPFIYPFSKMFREDVKIESLSKIKNLSIEKYIEENIDAPKNIGRSINIKNYKIVQMIKNLAEKFDDNEKIKKLKNFLEKTVVIDCYHVFLESKRFKQCVDKDLNKYIEKLKKLGYEKEKMNLYMVIFREKYEGIAKGFFP